MISTFLKNKEAIKTADVAKGVTIVHGKQRPHIMDEVEKLLLILIKEKELDGDSISEGIICEKALCIYADLIKETPSTGAEGESGITFKASRGWFEKCKHQSGINSVVRHGEAASSNKEAAEMYVGHKTLADDLPSDEDEVRESLPSSLIRGMCAKWGEVQLFVDKYLLDTMLANSAVHIFYDIPVMHFRKINNADKDNSHWTSS